MQAALTLSIPDGAPVFLQRLRGGGSKSGCSVAVTMVDEVAQDQLVETALPHSLPHLQRVVLYGLSGLGLQFLDTNKTPQSKLIPFIPYSTSSPATPPP